MRTVGVVLLRAQVRSPRRLGAGARALQAVVLGGVHVAELGPLELACSQGKSVGANLGGNTHVQEDTIWSQAAGVQAPLDWQP